MVHYTYKYQTLALCGKVVKQGDQTVAIDQIEEATANSQDEQAMLASAIAVAILDGGETNALCENCVEAHKLQHYCRMGHVWVKTVQSIAALQDGLYCQCGELWMTKDNDCTRVRTKLEGDIAAHEDLIREHRTSRG